MKKIIISIFIGLILTLNSYAEVKGTVGGRFQLVQISEMRRDQYLIDTQTGKIWQPICTKLASDGVGCEGTRIFQLVPVEGINFKSKDIKNAYELDNKTN